MEIPETLTTMVMVVEPVTMEEDAGVQVAEVEADVVAAAAVVVEAVEDELLC